MTEFKVSVSYLGALNFTRDYESRPAMLGSLRSMRLSGLLRLTATSVRCIASWRYVLVKV